MLTKFVKKRDRRKREEEKGRNEEMREEEGRKTSQFKIGFCLQIGFLEMDSGL